MKVTGNQAAARRPLPAPPVPPRPSKALVAEALARTRALTDATTRPTRKAPPPPSTLHTNGSEASVVNVTEHASDVGQPNGRLERTLNDNGPNAAREDPLANSHYSSITPTTILMIDNRSVKPVSPTLTRSEIPLVQNLVTELRECSQTRTHVDPVEKQEHDYSLLTISKKNIVKTCIQHSDWFQVEEDGHPIRYSSCQITLEDPPCVYTSDSPPLGLHFRNYQTQGGHTNSTSTNSNSWFFNKRRERMASLQGLPPLPKSLSGMNLLEGAGLTTEPQQGRTPPGPGARPSTSRVPSQARQPPQSPGPGVEGTQRPRKPTGLDAQLAVLRTEMFGLRQLDLSLLAQLWSLNESIQEFRQLLQEQETLSPPSPSSADDGDDYYPYLTSVPEQYCLSTSSSQSSIEYGNV